MDNSFEVVTDHLVCLADSESEPRVGGQQVSS